jgi:hypothetical protein
MPAENAFPFLQSRHIFSIQSRTKMKQLVIIALSLITVLVGTMAQGNGTSAARKLVEFGWDEPDTAFMRAHIAEMEKMPFDGCVFHINMTWQGWGEKIFTEADVKGAIDDLNATPFKKFTQNFLRFNTTPAKLDWFDDYSAVTNNARLAAIVARKGRCPGLLFDIEQYEGNLFDYRKQRDHETKSWDLYSAQARRRGREVMQAFQSGYPGIKLLLTFGYSLPWGESGQGKRPLSECHYGLLAPFLDGMLDAAEKGALLIDGCERAYGYKEAAQFQREYESMSRGLLPIVADAEKYRRYFSFGFGLWMDNNWRKVGWNTDDFSKNYFTPSAFESSLRAALKQADEYVWIYTETPRWWTKDGTPEKLPSDYVEAVRTARAAP